MQWISVKDKSRIPEFREEVITWDGKWMLLEECDYTLGDNNEMCFSESGTRATHWMPRPKPPRENG